MEQWRSLVEKYAGDIPPAYLLTLLHYESGGRPDCVMKTSHATGLFQITWAALADYNREAGTHFELEAMKDPELNTVIAVRTLHRIMKSYEKNHPESIGAPDWSSPRYLGLLTLGWNAGYSEASGVGYVVSAMEKAGVPKDKITATNVRLAADKLKTAGKHLREKDRVDWVRRLVMAFLGGKIDDDGPPTSKSTRQKYWIVGGVAVGVVGLLLYRSHKRVAAAEEKELREERRRGRLPGIPLHQPFAVAS